MKDAPVFYIDVACEDELDIIEKLIFLYSTSLRLRKKVPIILTDAAISLLALYFKHGYSSQTREICQETFGFDASRISSDTHKLKREGYLEATLVNKRKLKLNSELEAMKKFFDETAGNDRRKVLMMLNFDA